MSSYLAWVRTSGNLVGIVTAPLVVWALPMLAERPALTLLQLGIGLVVGWMALVTVGCVVIWVRMEPSKASAQEDLLPDAALEPSGD